MRSFILFLLLLILSFSSVAQVNLVPNPSFEDTVYCPFGTNQIEACKDWLNFGNSPDYFNACTPFSGIPNQSFGYQYAHNGNGMAGLGLYRRPTAPSGPNYREFIGSQLTSNMIIGQRYFFSFYINFSYQLPVAVACNKMGLRFSTIPFDSCCPPPINNFAHLHTDSILRDSVLWVRLSGSFIADSTYRYIGLGNFFDDNNTDTLRLGNLPDYSYYYIDDVCVTTDSNYNEIWTGLLYVTSSDLTINIYPNPCSDILNISTNETLKSISIIDEIGRTILYRKIDHGNSFQSIQLDAISSGLYFIKVETLNQIVVNRIIFNP